MSAKNIDRKGRLRQKVVGFRVSLEELRELDIMIKTSGLNRQSYIMSKLLDNTIVVLPNPRVFGALRSILIEVLEELKQNNSIGQPVCDETREIILLIIDVLKDIKGREE